MKQLDRLADPKKAKIFQRFFKTGEGEYGEGDIFIGVTVPQIRTVAKKHKDLSLMEVKSLISNSIHEYRLTALIILTYKRLTKGVVNFYLKHTEYINNWDLVDVSAYKIIGSYLIDKKDRTILYQLAKSKNLWEQRIAIVATFAFIRKNDFKDCLDISELLLDHKHDLIHKAVGWMLREVGKRDEMILRLFLKKHQKNMPRTMLRYAIEQLPDRKKILTFSKKR